MKQCKAKYIPNIIENHCKNISSKPCEINDIPIRSVLNLLKCSTVEEVKISMKIFRGLLLNKFFLI